jgi:choline-sulfatase
MTDQQSYNMMSCMGNPWLKTPNMDKIASWGYRFERAYCSNPVCTPSRFSLFTGHYASEIGAKENTSMFDQKKWNAIVPADALGLLLRKNGYATFYSGKVHLYGSKDATEYGFTINNVDPYDGPAIYAEQKLPELAKEGKPFAMFLSFLNPHDICYKAGADKRYPDKLTPENARETGRLLQVQKNMDPAEYRRQVPPRASNLEPIEGEQFDMVSMDIGSRKWDSTQWDLNNWMYLRLTESVDAQIGRVINALEKAHLRENTLIVFTTDHGDMQGAHGLTLKNVMYEECQRIPFIFAGKGIKENVSDKNTVVCNGTDFIPTLCDLIGVKWNRKLPGVSLKPLLTGKKTSIKRKYIFTESYNSFQINDGRYKYTVYELPGHPELLTDLSLNPGETKNYVNDSSYVSIKETLKAKLMSQLDKRGLLPLSEHRKIEELREMEKEYNKTHKVEKDAAE